jgi:CRISPR-associated protein Csy1
VVSRPAGEIEARRRAAIEAHRQGDLVAAESAWNAVLDDNPHDAEALYRLGLIAHARGALDLAAARLMAALGQRRGEPAFLYTLALVREDQGRPSEAVALLRQAIEGAPGFFQAHNNLGLLLLDQGDAAEAAAAFRRAIALRPDHASAWNHLGIALRAQDDREGALACFRRAAELAPGLADAHFNLGVMLLAQGQPRAAADALEAALRLRPARAGAHFYLAQCHLSLGALEAALAELRETLRIDPQHGEARCVLARELAKIGRDDEARELYEAERRRQPESLAAALGIHLHLPVVARSREELAAARSRFAAGLAQLRAERARFLRLPEKTLLRHLEWSNFFLAYQGGDDRALQTAYGAFVTELLGELLPQYLRALPPPRVAGRRIRVGFVSGFFRQCTVGRYFQSWITRLDRQRFEICVYRLGGKTDGMTAKIEGAADQAVALTGTLAEMAGRIRADAPDILVFPEVGMDTRTSLLAALRLAPVQCAAWGHPVTTGLPNVDHFLSVEAMEPPDAQAHYSERLVTLPGIGTHYERPHCPAGGTRAGFGLPPDKTLYLFPQSLFKIHPDNDAVLARVLAGDPEGVLVLFADRHPELTARFLARLDAVLAEQGLDAAERRVVLPLLPHDDYLRVNRLCDVMLDSLYWSGGNTSLDALACGLPLVTLPGTFMRGRQSMAMLRLAGVDELVAADSDDYVRIALRLGRDPDWRVALRERLAQGVNAVFGRDDPVKSLEAFLVEVAQAVGRQDVRTHPSHSQTQLP